MEQDDNLKSSLLKYFIENLPKLEQVYDWETPEILIKEYELIGNHYQKSKTLKLRLYERWKTADKQTRITLAEQIVAVWGGIRSNRPGTIERHIQMCQEKDGSWDWPLMGIASYSKILAIKNPEKFAVYDARVAVALNAAQFVYGDNPGKIFNYVPSRNNIIGKFIADTRFKRRTLCKHGWQSIPYKRNYKEYIKVICSLENELRSKSNFKHYRIFDLEMSLFASAETLAEQAIHKAEDKSI